MADQSNVFQAMDDFRQARQQAVLEQLFARLRGRSDELLSYEEVRQKLRGLEGSSRELREIPVDAIIGSVGRYKDFTRTFLPKEDVSSARWAKVMAAADSLEGLPPIEVYQIGQAYFVLDGNHRVSVARRLGMSHIQAYVREIKTRVPFSPDDDPDSLIVKAEYTNFLEATRFDEIVPGADLILTAPGKYPLLEEHIRIHQYYLGIEQQREISLEEAVTSFYQQVYLPVVEIIHRSGLMREFPDRTEADLYLWLAEHRAALQEALDMEVSPTRAALDLAEQKSALPERVASRLGSTLKKSLVPDELDPGPPVGTWRQNILERAQRSRLFKDILVPVSGEEESWQALEQALVVARHDEARLHGLHVVPETDDPQAQELLPLQERFLRRCQEAGIPATFAVQSGQISRQIADRTRWNDLVVLRLQHPPGSAPLERLGSGLRRILRQSYIPVLLVPDSSTALGHGLLAFDGSATAMEALYLAAYLHCGWDMRLTIITVAETDEKVQEIHQQARAYLEERQVAAEFIHKHGDIPGDILTAAREKGCDWLLTGSYSLNPLLEVVWGSTIESLLQEARLPLLISR